MEYKTEYLFIDSDGKLKTDIESYDSIQEAAECFEEEYHCAVKNYEEINSGPYDESEYTAKDFQASLGRIHKKYDWILNRIFGPYYHAYQVFLVFKKYHKELMEAGLK